MTKHIGIVGVSAEGAALCYRTLCAEGPALLGRHVHPEVTMHTYPLSDYMVHIEVGHWDEVAAMLLASARILHGAGADVLICPDNTVHQAIDIIRDRSPLAWLHIAEEVTRVAASRGFQSLLVLGTKYLMEGPVYWGQLRPRDIEYQIPEARERERINALIFDELVYGRFEEAARSFLRDVIDHGKSCGADAVVLGCTEIPLLIGEADSSLPILDSTRILARSALREAAVTRRTDDTLHNPGAEARRSPS
ncbi:MAG TPA: amino acid racemase [Gemmatimonadaceae bacterium]|nr:amino acid racemase [Gemmatimonadaceae bacterium]